MQYRRLGCSGLMVSEIAYGNWVTAASQLPDETAVACVHAALDVGITTFDTADEYADTRAERTLGQALAGQRRESVEILTKVYWATGDDRIGPNDRGLSRKHIMASIDGSLRRLGTDYVDVYQAHRFDHTTPLDETMQAFADVVRAGKALYLGVSEWRADEIRAGKRLADELHVPLVSNQPQYSMLWRVIEGEVAPACRELGVGQLAFSPIAQGVLTGKYLPGMPCPDGTRATDAKGGADAIRPFLRSDVLARVQQLRPVAADAGLTMPQLALAWVLQHDTVAATIMGASRPDQVVENAKAAGVALDQHTLSRIEQVLGPVVERDPALTVSPPRP